MERLLLSFLLLFVAYSSSARLPFRSIKSPDGEWVLLVWVGGLLLSFVLYLEIIHNYELVNLEIRNSPNEVSDN